MTGSDDNHWCTFSFDIDEIGEKYVPPSGSDGWDWDTEEDEVHCTREKWRDDRCIWHAEVTDKPVAELVERLEAEETPVILDKLYLREADLGDRLSLADVRATKADLTDANLRGADLTNFSAPDAKLSGANLFEATLDGADFS